MQLSYLIDFSFIVICFLMAAWEAYLIKKNRPIKHGWWTVIFYAFVGVVVIFTKNYWLILTATVLRECCFDIFLNLLRKLKIDYISSSPKSILDKINSFFFKENFWTLKINSFIVYLVLIILRARRILP